MRRWSCSWFVRAALTLGLSALSADAWAIAPMIGYSGRLLDAGGQPVTGSHDITFRIYDQATGGTLLFEETFAGQDAIAVNAGYFWVLLANNAAGPTEIDLTLALNDQCHMELEVDGGLLEPRQQMAPVPWALASGIAKSAGGAGLGGDGDTLASLNCADGMVPKSSAGNWACAPDNAGSGAGGAGGGDTLAALSCGSGQLAKFIGGSWICSDDIDTAGALACTNVGEVLKWNGTDWVCAADSTGAGGSVSWLDIPDVPTSLAQVAALSCTAGDVISWNGSAWTCGGVGTIEADPVFSSSTAAGISPAQVASWDTAASWGNHASAGYLTGFTESDPEVGGAYNGYWCRGTGSSVECDQTPPVMAESDPRVGNVYDGYWCRGYGSTVECDQFPPVDTDTNSATLCGDNEYLRGDGACVDVGPYRYDGTLSPGQSVTLGVASEAGKVIKLIFGEYSSQSAYSIFDGIANDGNTAIKGFVTSTSGGPATVTPLRLDGYTASYQYTAPNGYGQLAGTDTTTFQVVLYNNSGQNMFYTALMGPSGYNVW